MRSWADVYPAGHAVALHAAGGVHGISKQTVPRHAHANNTRHDVTCVCSSPYLAALAIGHGDLCGSFERLDCKDNWREKIKGIE